jgi:serine/threonine protein kinase/tetratricopeptide (TPR) repeat protein
VDAFRGSARFQVLSRLGMGGMGVVYEAFDHERGQRVALKTLHNVDSVELVQLKNEFRRLQQVQHPNVARLYELHGEGGQWFFTMELIDGVDFHGYVRGVSDIRRRPTQSRPSRPAAEHTVRVSSSSELLPPPPMPGDLPPSFDETKLRLALRGLASALAALHEHGLVHLDVKPTNVLVTPEGRVVLLDFGLAAASGDDPALEPELLAGTPAYMAPEQVDGAVAAASADWYAVGVLAFEAMTGQRPRVGRTRPAEVVPGIPADLDGLCARLLDRDPAKRPGGAEVVELLGATPTPEPRQATVFVGRGAELSVLAEAQSAAAAGAGVTLVIEGEAGIGKSALVREYLVRTPDAVAFAARCHERESVPFRAVDGIVDALGRHLLWLPREVAESLLAPGAELLLRVFPSLRRVEAFSALPVPDAALPLAELRGGAFRALRAIFAKLAERSVVILWIDDLHWADPDSRALLAVLAGPAPPPRVFLVATSREERLAWLPLGARRLVLSPLAAGEAIDLARALSPRGADPEAIAAASAGHPLFVAEVARHADGLPKGARLRLEDALAARVTRLPSEARDLLELVAVAGSPVATLPLAAALGSAPIFWEALDALGHTQLIRTSSEERPTDAPLRVEIYHDRLREAVVAGLSQSARRQRHERMALALERSTGDEPELLARSWLGAGEPARAAPHFAAAGHRAAEALAFEQAAALYGRAIACGLAGEERAWVEERLGDVFAARGETQAAEEHYAGTERSLRDDDVAGRVRVLRKRAELLRQRGHSTEAEEVLSGALIESRTAGLTLEEGRTLHQLARVAMYRADYDTADERAQAAHQLARASGSADLALVARVTQANVAIFRGEPLHAIALVEVAALELGAAAESTQAEFYASRGRALLHAADYARATLALEEAAQRFRRLGLAGREAGVLNNLGAATFYQGEWEQAKLAWARFVGVCERRDDVQELATGLNNLAHVASQQGDFDEAAAQLARALAVAGRVGRPHTRGLLLGNRAELDLMRGELGAAREALRECESLFAQLGAREDALETKRRLADLALADGRPADALSIASDAAVAAAKAGLRLEAAALLRVRATALRSLGRFDEAKAALSSARTAARSLHVAYEDARLELEAAELAAAAGDRAEAAERAADARGRFERLGARPWAARARALVH